ncbi:hypothetical protein FHG66_11275 [Rubellimicrobium rubrum]|uniref:Uncharacterized protein n=1 Tax=Rubellimicrobium rubrum TaxID=2585369 RepID=A0A5C4MXG0_9RHOB|nr:hypothetical protein [Rubellimicrobium rubrum]TNC49309.1 hypothetical protein FHG66_11275 [Rubellimicrobium rubrum]
MTDEEKMMVEAKRQVSAEVAQGLRQWVQALVTQGLPIDAILAGSHWEAVRLYCEEFGPEKAAAMCERTAKRVRLHAEPIHPLASATPAGRA